MPSYRVTCDRELLKVQLKVTRLGRALTVQGSWSGSPSDALTTRGADHAHTGGSREEVEGREVE